MPRHTNDRRSRYIELLEARSTLGLPERASMAMIKHRYRTLLRHWHPDTCKVDHHQCLEMTRRITAAYTIILNYCNDYEFSFTEDEVQRYCTAEEWWANRFADVPW